MRPATDLEFESGAWAAHRHRCENWRLMRAAAALNHYGFEIAVAVLGRENCARAAARDGRPRD